MDSVFICSFFSSFTLFISVLSVSFCTFPHAWYATSFCFDLFFISLSKVKVWSRYLPLPYGLQSHYISICLFSSFPKPFSSTPMTKNELSDDFTCCGEIRGVSAWPVIEWPQPWIEFRPSLWLSTHGLQVDLYTPVFLVRVTAEISKLQSICKVWQ